MKKITSFFSLIAIAAILFSACKKSSSPTTLQRIQAKWGLQKEYYHDNYGGVDSRDTTYGTSTDYADFRTDGKVYYKYGTN